jgi:uncharacterized protein with PQ loop repeat
MHSFLASVLVIVGLVSVAASVPQLVQLLKVKNSDEFNVSTWSIWLLYQVVTLLYTVDIKSVAYSFINSLWLLFYSYMLFLIIKYRPQKELAAEVEEADQKS